MNGFPKAWPGEIILAGTIHQPVADRNKLLARR